MTQNTTKLTSLEQLKTLDFKAPPALSTKVEGKEKKERKGYVYNKVTPTYTAMLSKKEGPTAASKMIGCTAQTLGAGVRAGAIYAPIEKAAEGIWKDKYEPKTVDRAPLSKTERLLVLRLSTNDLKAMEDWLSGNNVSYSVLS